MSFKRTTELKFEKVEELVERIGHAEPALEWLLAPNTYKIQYHLVMQNLLKHPDEEIRKEAAAWIRRNRNLELVARASAMDAGDLLVIGGIISAAKKAAKQLREEEKKKEAKQ